jgi:beta-lactamase regulating signal transducer with metallopeptidase domain
MYALGWTLIHFLWQGAAIAALAAASMSFCRRSSTRYVTGVAALALMLAMPFVTLHLLNGPELRTSASISSAPFSATAIPLETSGLAASSTTTINNPVAVPLLPTPSFPALEVFPWLVEGWLCGVTLLSLRFAGGFLLLEQKHRRQSTAPSARVLALCRAVQQRLGLTRTVRYLECGWLRVPAVIGCIRPVVLLPVAALTGLTEVQLRAVIAHELAHVRRWDFLVNLFQILTETLLFYHPAIWWLNKRIRAERELCCDEIAMEAGDRIEYAHALVLMAKLGSASGLAMAATHGILSERIFHILGRPSAKPRIAGLAGSLFFFMAAMAAGNALLVLAAPLPAPHARGNTQAIASWHVASLAGVSARPQLESLAVGDAHPAATGRLDDNHYVIPRRNWLASIRTIRPSPVSFTPLMMMPVNLENPPAPEDRPVVAAPETGAPPHPRSVVAQELEARTAQYPAPVLKLSASRAIDEWTQVEAANYCKDYTVQTVTQGANRPMTVDDGVKQRLSFFYWHCMLSNNNGVMRSYGAGLGNGPAYVAVGAASSDHPVDVSGNWAISFPSSQPSLGAMMAMQMGARSCSFSQEGNIISGTCAGREGSSAATGIIDGRQVRWSWQYTFHDRRRKGEMDFLGMVGSDGVMTGQSISIEEVGNRLEAFKAMPGGAQVASQE